MATRHCHADVDRPWLGLLHPKVSRAQYVTLLLRTYGFVAPLESACKYTPGLDELIDTRRLTRSGLLAQDLLMLGLTPARLATSPQCGAITTFRDVPEALGWLYVVERTALVQDSVRRYLLEQLPGMETACAYLTSLDGREHWVAFRRMLDRIGARPDVANEIVASANAAFECARRWNDNAELEARKRTG